MFFNWLPRSIFTWKPFGIGFSSVYDIYPTALYFGEGYSHSVGFVGESALFFGEFYFIGLGLYALSIYALVGVLQLTLRSVAQIVPVVVYMCTLRFLWGGGAAFGGRFWEPLVALLVCAFLTRRINRGSHV
jgi:hypothetical protein